jgi:uncharacterized protein (TIGR02598 family)
MKPFGRCIISPRCDAFSLVEVVLALGVISFAIVAILGVFPVGLATGHSAQDETRAPQIAQTILASFASQAPTISGTSSVTFDLTASNTQNLYAGNDGQLLPNAGGATYAVSIITNSTPTDFDSGYANQVTIIVGWPATALVANQTKRDFVRIISKY